MASLVSVGTEKYMLELAQKSLLGKALARPDLVRQVIAKAQAGGILEAWRQAMGRLDTPVPLRMNRRSCDPGDTLWTSNICSTQKADSVVSQTLTEQ
jgi:hypothetical protein